MLSTKNYILVKFIFSFLPTLGPLWNGSKKLTLDQDLHGTVKENKDSHAFSLREFSNCESILREM